ncbi:MAG: hypothetical protein SVX43_05075 [Cyanobacteriota bacterium]|nr:hypothetical protein [Cyanobacteriota bacterium]
MVISHWSLVCEPSAVSTSAVSYHSHQSSAVSRQLLLGISGEPNRSIAQFGGRDVGTFSDIWCRPIGTSECLDLKT